MRQNMLSHRPRLYQGVVSSKQQRTFQSIAFAETRNAHQFIDVFSRIRVARYGRKYAKLCLGHCCRSWLAFAEISNVHDTPNLWAPKSALSAGAGGAPEHAQPVAVMKRFGSVGRSSLSLPARPSYTMGLCDRGLERFAVTSNWAHSNDLTTSALSNSPSIAAAAVTPLRIVGVCFRLQATFAIGIFAGILRNLTE
jgi:hypothetical protein